MTVFGTSWSATTDALSASRPGSSARSAFCGSATLPAQGGAGLIVDLPIAPATDISIQDELRRATERLLDEAGKQAV